MEGIEVQHYPISCVLFVTLRRTFLLTCNQKRHGGERRERRITGSGKQRETGDINDFIVGTKLS